MPAYPVEGLQSPPAPSLTVSRPWRLMLLVTNLALDGGAEVQVIELAIRLQQRGWNVQIVCIRPPIAGVAMLAEHGIAVFTLPRSNRVWALAKLLREQRPHILHSHMNQAVLLARAAAVLHRPPVSIGTLHGLKMYNARGEGWRAREVLGRLTEGLADVTSVVCQAAARHHLSSRTVSRKRLRLIPNGIDTTAFRPDSRLRAETRRALGLTNEFAWLLVARFQPVKDHCTLLRCFSRVASAQPASQLLLAGDGPLKAEMTEFAEALGIASRVRFLGRRSGIAALVNAADAFVLSSLYEASPLVLLEAAATGLPIVATDVGGVSEIVLDGVTGYLTPSGDAESLAQSMLRLASLPAGDRAVMGSRAREHVMSNFRFETIVSLWEELYTELLERKEARP